MKLEIKQLSIKNDNKVLCDQLNFTVSTGEFWAVLGKNGVGKTTLLNTLCGISLSSHMNTTQGDIILINADNNSQNIKQFKTKQLAKIMGLMQQDYEYTFPCTVKEAVLMSRYPHLSSWQFETTEDMRIVKQCLQQTHLENFIHRQIQSLSGGEKRRLHLAMLMAQSPEFLLLDEPTNHLDLSTQIKFMALLHNHFQLHKKAGIMVSHDMNLINRYCDHVLLLFDDGKWLCGTTEQMMTEENLTHLLNHPIKTIHNKQQVFFIPA